MSNELKKNERNSIELNTLDTIAQILEKNGFKCVSFRKESELWTGQNWVISITKRLYEV